MMGTEIRQDQPPDSPEDAGSRSPSCSVREDRVRTAFILLVIFLVALVPRILYVIQIETLPFSDMADYDRCAMNFLLGDGLIQSPEYRAYRTPGYPLLLAAIYSVADNRYQAVYLMQCVLGALTAVLTVLLFLKCFPKIPQKMIFASVAGLIMALSDESIFYCGQLLTETLYTLLFVVWVLLLLRLRPRPQNWLLVTTAVLHGLLLLVRPVAGLYVILIAGFLYLRSSRDEGNLARLSRSLLSFVVYMAVLIATILPWSIRNYVVTGYFIPLSTNDGVNFYIGHNPDFGYWSTGNKTAIRESTDLDEYQESRLFFRLGLEYILNNPKQDLWNNIKKIGYLYTTTWKPWPWFNYGRELRFANVPWLPVWGWSHLAMVVIGVGAVVSLWSMQQTGLLIGCIVIQTVSCVVFFARARFRLPLIPLFAVLAAYAVFLIISMPWRRNPGKRRAAD